jgi:hypothetical protein
LFLCEFRHDLYSTGWPNDWNSADGSRATRGFRSAAMKC